ncbi:MAG: TlpA family protein disulfide reductase [Thiotrichales bacterium]|nr:TlpA family protein disulfide reductase [Thiotrichales bacterium]
MKNNSLLHRYGLAALLSLSFLAVSAPVQAQEEKEIVFVDLDGNKSKLSDYKGKWVVVNLWATWCPPCLKEIPDLVMFHEAHAKTDAVVIGVNYEDLATDKVKAFAESQLVNYPIVRFETDPDGKTTPFGDLRGLPTTYMVNPEGKIVAARTGMVDAKMLNDFIQNYKSPR